jgi:hypothetical protein
MANAQNIISASRRTDIPRFYARWFTQRRQEGRVKFRNSFGGKGSVSLQDEDVLGYLFWTRYAKPFRGELRALLDVGLPCIFQYTVTGYDREIEPHTPETGQAVDDFHAISAMLPAPDCIQWRYDPIVINDAQPIDWHFENFERITARLQGATRVVNTSFIEPYVKAIRRMNDPTTVFRRIDENRHKTVMKRYPDLVQVDDETAQTLLTSLSDIARKYGMGLRMCANPEWDFPKSQCCGKELFAPYGEERAKQIESLILGPSRPACRCLKTVDIGMDNTCLGGCKYCYVVTSHDLAVKNYRTHVPDYPMLR